MNRPTLLDAYCGAGGAGEGYARAGFDVTGVDNRPQPRYPHRFIQADALTYIAEHGHEYDAIHASPPCHDHTELGFKHGGRLPSDGTGWMLGATIEALRSGTAPWVVENVPRAEMPGAFTLCARSFGATQLRRHRKFLTSFPVLIPPCACQRGAATIGVYGDLSRSDRSMGRNPDGRRRYSVRAGVATARELLGCPWMTGPELSQAIPPAYTEFVGEQLRVHLTATVPTGGAL